MERKFLYNKLKNDDLISKSKKIRKDLIKMLRHAGSGHPGGSLSIVEILIALYSEVMNISLEKINDPERDRFVLSKGHGGPALYAVLANEGFFPKEWLSELNVSGSKLPMHIDRLKMPCIEVSTGPLGQGFSMAIGMAIAERIDTKRSYNIYVLIGDGETNSGQIWEAAMCAVKYRLDNLIAITDRNGLQVDGPSDEIMPLGDLQGKWEAFGWNVSVINGHDFNALLPALSGAKELKNSKPNMIIANTTKGKGVSFMENKVEWHSKKVTAEEAEIALKELEA